MRVVDYKGFHSGAKQLGNGKHGIAGLHDIASREAGAAGRGHPGAGWDYPRDAEHVTGENQIGIGNLGIGGN